MRDNFLSVIVIFLMSVFTIQAQSNLWYNFPAGVPEYANRYIYVDSSNAKWAGGYSNGLHKFSNGVWTSYNTGNSGIPDNDVRESCFDTLGNLWIATWNKLGKWNVSSNTWTSFNLTGQTNDILYSVIVDKKNRVWAGTDGGANPTDGLYMLRGNGSWKYFNTANSALTGTWISQLRKDKLGRIWGCSAKDVFEINDTVIVNHSIVAGGFPSGAGAICLDFDSYNHVWAGTNAGGIGMFDGTGWTIYNTSNSPLPDNNIWSIAVDNNNVVWIGTETQGLVKFDGTTWTIYNTTNSAITNNRIDALSVDKLNNVWIAPSYGGIMVHNPQGLSGVSGHVYYDVNGNNARDSNEPAMRNQGAYMTTGNFVSITDTSGYYFNPVLNAGSFYEKLYVHSPYITGVAPDSISVAVSNSVTGLQNQDFAVHMQANIHDVSVDMTSFGHPRPGFEYGYHITAKNIGTLPTDSIALSLDFSPSLVFDSLSVSQGHLAGQNITLRTAPLALFEETSFTAYFHLPPDPMLIGTNVASAIQAYDTYADHDSTNNATSVTSLVVGSFDPNEKIVSPAGTGLQGIIPPGTPELEYTIGFQNTGTAEAFTVVLKDTISPGLDLASIEMISSSHPYQMQIKNGGIVWTFSHINLPDSASSEAGSHGYVKYKIRLKPNLPLGTQIKNTGYIYFDYNPAIITNRTVNTINNSIVTSVATIDALKKIRVYPNPSNGILNVDIMDGDQDNDHSLVIYNSFGQEVYSVDHMQEGSSQVHVEELAAGIYLIRVLGKNFSGQASFVKVN